MFERASAPTDFHPVLATRTEDVVLRAVTAENLDPLHNLLVANKSFLAQTTELPEQLSMQSAHRHLRLTELFSRPGSRAEYGAWYRGEVVGAVKLHSRDGDRMQLGYWIAEEFNGRGIAKVAARRLAEFGLQKMKLDAIDLYIRQTNEPSKGVAHSLGATIIGQTTKHDRHKVEHVYDIWSVSNV